MVPDAGYSVDDSMSVALGRGAVIPVKTLPPVKDNPVEFRSGTMALGPDSLYMIGDGMARGLHEGRRAAGGKHPLLRAPFGPWREGGSLRTVGAHALLGRQRGELIQAARRAGGTPPMVFLIPSLCG